MIDILYLAWNRLAFTDCSFDHLIRNTDWSYVRNLVVVDDGSVDGTAEYLVAARETWGDLPVAAAGFVLLERELRSPVAVMNEYTAGDPADVFAKIDNDVVVPPGWLETMLGVLDSRPDVELLGMEAGMTGSIHNQVGGWSGVYSFQEASHIGGVGLMRSSAFTSRRSMYENGRFGFTEWQLQHQPTRGWITPDLMVPCLDRVPVEPWASLSEGYIREGWQRRWPRYDVRWPYWWDWMGEDWLDPPEEPGEQPPTSGNRARRHSNYDKRWE